MHWCFENYCSHVIAKIIFISNTIFCKYISNWVLFRFFDYTSKALQMEISTAKTFMGKFYGDI